MKLSAFLLLISFACFGHAGKLNTFTYSKEGNAIQLKVVLKNADVLELGKKLNDGCDFKNLTSLCISKYILENSSLEYNGITLPFVLGDSKIESGHITLHFKANPLIVKANSLIVKNNCFYVLDKDYKNRIRLNLYKIKKSYLLKKGQNEIVVL